MLSHGAKVTKRTSRFEILKPAVLISLPVFFVFRVLLLISRYADVDVPFYKIVSAFLLGAINDLAFLSYFLIPFVIYLLIIPNRVFHSGINRLIIYALFFVSLYGLYFDMAAEWLFWDEFSVRFNFIAVDYLIYTHEVVNNIIESYPLPAFLAAIFAVSAFTFWYFRKHISEPLTVEENFRNRLSTASLLLLFPALSYAAVDQNLHRISNNSFINEIAANGPYQFFAAFRNNEIDYRQFYALGQDQVLSDEIKTLVSDRHGVATEKPIYDIKRNIMTSGPEKHLNVIIITVESLSADFFSRFGNQENITPHMDKLFDEGLLFTNFYATGTRTDRGLEALTLSVPPTPGRSIVKRPDNGKLFSLGRVFQQKGYDTVFLYGGRGYFDNMNEFFSGNGYRIIDQTDLSEQEIHFKNAWGVADEDIYQRAVKEADKDYADSKPFLFQIMTTSNHRPFTFPSGKIDIASGTGRSGAVKYTDYAIGELIKTAKNKPWFDDTLFVVVADHCAGSARKAELPVENYHIPFFIYAPKHVAARQINTLASQIDVAPTLLGLLNFSYVSEFFGKDIRQMKPAEGRALIGNYQKLGLFENNKLVYLSPQQQINIVNNPLVKPEAQTVENNQKMTQQDMAYYQAADYIWTHRLSRYN